jgi:hypothetical protein
MARVLKPGGQLMLTSPKLRSLLRRTLVGIHRLTRAVGRPWPRYLGMSKNEYSPRGLRETLAARGFEVLRVVPFGGPMPSWLQRGRFLGSLLLAVTRKAGAAPAIP